MYNNVKPFAGFLGAGESAVTILSSKILQVFQIPQVLAYLMNFSSLFCCALLSEPLLLLCLNAHVGTSE